MSLGTGHVVVVVCTLSPVCWFVHLRLRFPRIMNLGGFPGSSSAGIIIVSKRFFEHEFDKDCKGAIIMSMPGVYYV